MSNFTIALSGLGEDDIASVQAALDTPDSHWSMVDGVNADLLMVDIDSVWGHMDWLRATATGRRTIAFTDQAEVRNCDLLLHKPLQPAQLVALLADLDRHSVDGKLAEDVPAPAQPNGAAPASDVVTKAAAVRVDHRSESKTADPQRLRQPVAEAPQAPSAADISDVMPPQSSPPITPEVAAPEPVIPVSLVARARAAADLAPATKPAASVQAAVAPLTAPPAAKSAVAVAASPATESSTIGQALLAGEISAPVRVESHGTVLQIDPERGGYHAPAMLKPLQPLLELPLAVARPLDAHALEQLHLSPALPLTRLLWFAALCATPGELTPQLDAGAVYHLTRWPQIEREFPRHFRIATALMKQPGTLESIAEAAKAPVGDVADFINAYYMAGFVNTDGDSAPRGGDGSDSGMRSKLRRPFGR